MRRGSNIEHDTSLPHVAFTRELQAVIGRGLDERLELRPPADERRFQRSRAESYIVGALSDKALAVGEEDQLLQPLDEQRCTVGRFDYDRALFIRAGALEYDEFRERCKRVCEDLFFGGRLDRELDLRRVTTPFIHRRRRLPRNRRSAPRTRRRLRAATDAQDRPPRRP